MSDDASGAGPKFRFTAAAAAKLRDAISEAGGIEVFAVGRLDGQGLVAEIEVHCRGNEGAVTALLSRSRPGEVVIHNHPSGHLVASNADMALAGRFGEDGVGMVIVDNAVERDFWVTEPHRKILKAVTEDEIRRVFTEKIPLAMPGHEARQPQVEMALHVARSLNEGHISISEAGTGTGKSLAYLVPAVLWALKNENRVAVATYTINLQAQLVSSDIPVLHRAGIRFEHALLKGRSNYICRRRLGEEAEREGAEPVLRDVAKWAETAAEGSRADLGFPLNEEQWDLIASDHDQTLRARCPHFGECFYYQARRRAARAHIVVVNHHLLLADLLVKGETGGDGILPRFDRVVLDEGHHLEDAATSLFQQQLTARGLRRTIRPLIPRKKRAGALDQLAGFHLAADSPLPMGLQQEGQALAVDAQQALTDLYERVGWWMENIAAAALSPEVRQLRVQPPVRDTPLWSLQIEPAVRAAAERIAQIARELGKIEDIVEQLPEDFQLRDPQPLLDLSRCRRRLGEQASMLYSFLARDDEQVRWIELARGRNISPTAALCLAPVEVGPTLRERVFEPMTALATCSATMTVDGRFDHFLGRVGLAESQLPTHTARFPSPFDYTKQALLGLPLDIPDPTRPDFEEVAARFIIDALRVSGGGAFVLCTSFRLLKGLHRRCRAALGRDWMLLRQGEQGRSRLLDLFRQNPDSVLFGTDSFWEGVSVKGDSLRLVIIPRLPFRVPTEPVQQARHEKLAKAGLDPFKVYSLPQAVLRFRQGFGRLIRTRSDRGAVLVLDRRIHSRWYGKTFLNSLPQMETTCAPGAAVLERLEQFYKDNRPG
ncbi:MAG: ATP-dependent DNA helicase DinG [Myxococcota bacterium]|jgi:ATP-dependent DNA helicase DinG